MTTALNVNKKQKNDRIIYVQIYIKIHKIHKDGILQWSGYINMILKYFIQTFNSILFDGKNTTQ